MANAALSRPCSSHGSLSRRCPAKCRHQLSPRQLFQMEHPGGNIWRTAGCSKQPAGSASLARARTSSIGPKGIGGAAAAPAIAAVLPFFFGGAFGRASASAFFLRSRIQDRRARHFSFKVLQVISPASFSFANEYQNLLSQCPQKLNEIIGRIFDVQQRGNSSDCCLAEVPESTPRRMHVQPLQGASKTITMRLPVARSNAPSGTIFSWRKGDAHTNVGTSQSFGSMIFKMGKTDESLGGCIVKKH